MKNCPFCHNSTIHKHGTKNNIQRYKCPACNKTFSFTKKLNANQIWFDYSVGKQAYKQLAEKYHCSIRTIQRYIDKAPKAELALPKRTQLNLLMDVTFFGREFGILVLLDSLTNQAVYHQVVKTEKDIYYKIAINKLRDKGYIIQSITCDGRRGLLKDILNTPVQMCQFHLIAIVMRKLRKKHRSIVGKEVKIVVKTLTASSKNEFYIRLHHWFITHQSFLNERYEIPNERGYCPYKHRNVRGAYTSIKRYIFTFEKH